jgi:hypothetical protein
MSVMPCTTETHTHTHATNTMNQPVPALYVLQNRSSNRLQNRPCDSSQKLPAGPCRHTEATGTNTKTKNKECIKIV